MIRTVVFALLLTLAPSLAAQEPDAGITEDAQPSRGSVTVGGRTIAYTATPGTLTLRNHDGEPIASMFYVAYVADHPKGAPQRPITFAFNGGPGSSSMFLHIGSFGPVRVEMSGGPMPPAPYKIVDNRYSMLDRTDLVFMDMIGTGLSRAVGKGKEQDFWGVDADIDAFSRGIMRYLTINDRWNSPKFLFGESYGTARAAGLSYALGALAGGVKLNGVILQASHLNRGLLLPTNEHNHVTDLPTYAATAWYHKRIPNRPNTLEPFLTEVREWARGPYATFLAKGYEATEDERKATAEIMNAYTGLSVEYLLASNLRVSPPRFRKELLRDKRRTVGRLDSRLVGVDTDAAGDEPEYDANVAVNAGPFVSGINRHLFGTLGYKTKLQYRPNNYANQAGRWEERHKPAGAAQAVAMADLTVDLSRAMRENPYMKVLSLNGYYDIATPFFAAEYDLKHMQIEPVLQKNITFEYFEAGHMMYANPDVLPKFKAALDAFYDSALAARP